MLQLTWVRSVSLALSAGALLLSGSPVIRADDGAARQTSGVIEKTAKLDAKLAEPSYEQLTSFKVKGKITGNSLQTLCADAQGNIVAVVAPQRYGPPPKSKVTSEIHVYSAEGKLLQEWKVPFAAQSVNVGPDGKVFVAGDAHIAKFEPDGKPISDTVLPHIEKIASDSVQIRKDAELQIKQQKESFERSVKQYKDQVKRIKEKKQEELTAREKSQLQQAEMIVKSFQEQEKYYQDLKVDDVVQQTLGRLRYINSVVPAKNELFIVCGETKGYGYAIWRMDYDLANPKQIIRNVSGCCGQMDACCDGDNLILAENSNKKFARYDRDGKVLGKWGKSGDKDADGFGGCCNPMNVRIGAKGDIFTSESEGIIKRFSSKGEFLGIVGKVKISGGCKNVAIAMSPNEERVYFCDQPTSQIYVLGKKKTVASR